MNGVFAHTGEMAAIGASIVWAIAVILFKKSGEQMHPIALNLFKNLLSFFLLIPTILLFGETLLHTAPLRDYLILLSSGILGIAIADTLFFKCLNLIGAGLYSIISCLYIPIVITLSILFLSETLTLWQVAGIIMIFIAVPVATLGNGNNRKEISRRDIRWGIFWGLSALAISAVGIVIAKPVLQHSPVLWATHTRLFGAIIVLAVIFLFHPRRREVLTLPISKSGWFYTTASSFAGAYLSMILWLAAMKLAQVSIVSSITQTSNVFIFIFAAVFLREPINWRRILGIILAVSGTLLATFGQ
jgi:drug/metabolite transporter (DMT)-like permease